MNKRELRKFRDQYTNWELGCPSEGLKLAVHFDEKDFVKRMGARWQPDPSGKGGYWWMPGDNLDNDADNMPAYINIFDADNGSGIASGTVLEYLNVNKMIEGLHGTISPTAAEEVTANIPTANQHHYILSDGASEYAVIRFADVGLVRFKEGIGVPIWYNEADGKSAWENLVGAGFYLLSEETV